MKIQSQKIAGIRVGAMLVLALFSMPILSVQDIINVGDFSSTGLAGWDQKSFAGETLYSIEKDSELMYLQASANKSASALYKTIKVDLEKTPYLNWSWRVDKPLPELDEQTKAGDDYSARIYVIVKRGLIPWNTNALNYIWSSNQAPKQAWPNAYTDKAIMIPIRTSLDANQVWKSEKVNIKLDFEKFFGVEVDAIDGVAIMVDTDNSQLQAAASFGDIYFSSN